MYNIPLRVSADPWVLNRPLGLVQRPPIMKSVTFASSAQTLSHLNLSHIDFLDDPAAIHWSRLIISCATQDAGPNELTNPEILMKTHHKYTHNFALIWLAIFPDTDISSCVCIVLLFETSSSSHVECHIARQRKPLGHGTSIWACLMSSEHEICQISIKWTDLVSPKSPSHWFSGWPRCNPLMQTDNISCHTRRGPKRIDQSWDIDEKPSQIYTLFRLDIACNLP